MCYKTTKRKHECVCVLGIDLGGLWLVAAVVDQVDVIAQVVWFASVPCCPTNHTGVTHHS